MHFYIGLSPGQFFFLPFMDGYSFWRTGQVIPEVFYQLEFLRRTEVENGRFRGIHGFLRTDDSLLFYRASKWATSPFR